MVRATALTLEHVVRHMSPHYLSRVDVLARRGDDEHNTYIMRSATLALLYRDSRGEEPVPYECATCTTARTAT